MFHVKRLFSDAKPAEDFLENVLYIHGSDDAGQITACKSYFLGDKFDGQGTINALKTINRSLKR